MEARVLALDDGTLLEELGWVYGLARRLVTDANDADDLVQEAWLKARSTPAERFSSRTRLRAWLAAVTRRLARDSRRARGRRARREEFAAQSEVHASAADVVERSALLEAVLHAVRRLDEPYRSTVLLRYMDGYATAEVAAEMSVSDELVRKRLSRALARLRSLLAKEWDGVLPEGNPDGNAELGRLDPTPGVAREPLAAMPIGAARSGRKFDSQALGAALLAGLGLVLVAQLLPTRFQLPGFGETSHTAPESTPLTFDSLYSSQGSGAVNLLDADRGASSEADSLAETDPAAPTVAVHSSAAEDDLAAGAGGESAAVESVTEESAAPAPTLTAEMATPEPSPAEQASPSSEPTHAVTVLDPADAAALGEPTLRVPAAD